jgi:hypothetical protein
MSFSLSVLTSTGHPFYFKQLKPEPSNTDLNMRFYNFVAVCYSGQEKPDQSFELQAGLVAALFEFARLLDHPIELLKFKTASADNNLDDSSRNSSSLVSVSLPENSDVLITTRADIFLNPRNYEAKIHLIYNYIIKKHIPLGPDKRITDADEVFITGLLSDNEARTRIQRHQEKLNDLCKKMLQEYTSYGLEAIVITSFDANPLLAYGYSLDQVLIIFRELGIIPNVKEYQWVFRTSRYNNIEKGLLIINSGCGVKIKDVFMPYHYILITTQEAFLGDTPTTIYQHLNAVLDE